MSERSAKIEGMDGNLVLTLIVGLLVGIALGCAAAWQVLRSRAGAERSHDEAYLASLRSEAAQARERVAQIQTEVAKADATAAQARTEAAVAHAEAAEVSASLASARAERDAALDRAAKLAEDREALVNQFKVLSGETLDKQGKVADQLALDRLRRTEEILTPLTDIMGKFAERLSQVEKERAAMSTDLRNQVQAVQSTGEHLRRETHALATALRKPQVRGAWGELQLRRVAEYAGMVDRCDFELQATTTTTADATIRPDMKVHLADGKFLYVDAKVPLSAFLDAYETEDFRTREEKLVLFGRNVRTHIDQLSRKEYWKAATGTPEFVVLFLPNEQFLASALEQLPDLHEYAAKRDIVVATPNTLIAMLRAVAYGWKQAALAESAAEVFALGRELHERMATMGGHIDKLGRSLTAAVKAYNTTVGSVETRVFVSTRKFRDLQVTDAELASPAPVNESVRPLTAAELVEDATRATPMIGRSRKDGLPEQPELNRGEPELFELVDPEVSQRHQPKRRSG